MPVTIQPTTLRYKNGNTFTTVDCLKGDPGSISVIAPDYNDLTFPVASGKLCTYDDKLYVANQQIASSEVWTATHWTETTVEQIIDDKADKTDTVLETTLSRGRKASTAKGYRSLAFGNDVTASGNDSQAVGNETIASGYAAFAEGNATEAIGQASHVEGSNNIASGLTAHAEGIFSVASGSYSHAENARNKSGGDGSHTEGFSNITNATASHVEGMNHEVDASQKGVHVGGVNATVPTTTGKTIVFHAIDPATGQRDQSKTSTFVLGQFAELIGNGNSESDRSNARTLDWDGNEYLAGNVYVNCNADSTGGTMLQSGMSFVETVSGATPTITGTSNTRYICGEVSTLNITPPAVGIIDVRFTSGSTATVVTVPNTVVFPAWFDITSLEANTVYEIMITDGVYGGVMTWPA